MTRHYFSNGTEHEMWSANWCDRCTHDHDWHANERGCGCDVVLAMLRGDDSPFIENTGDLPASHLRCLLFSACPCNGEGGDVEPVVAGPMPGQEQLFDPAETPVGIIWRTDPGRFMGTPAEVAS